jgi:hypothetical protein
VLLAGLPKTPGDDKHAQTARAAASSAFYSIFCHQLALSGVVRESIIHQVGPFAHYVRVADGQSGRNFYEKFDKN